MVTAQLLLLGLVDGEIFMILYKFKSTQNLMHLLDIVVHERLYCPLYSELNDPFEGQFRELLLEGRAPETMEVERSIAVGMGIPGVGRVVYHDLMELAKVKATRVCSLTERHDDVRMWSLYADSHRGVAIEIDFDSYEHLPVKVSYNDCLPIGGAAELEAKSVDEILSGKSSHWSYEAEYRLITAKSAMPVTGRIKRVLLGIRVERPLIELLDKVMDPRIEMVRMRLVHGKVEVAVGEKVDRARQA